jgi:Tol biopolymer transport system component
MRFIDARGVGCLLLGAAFALTGCSGPDADSAIASPTATTGPSALPLQPELDDLLDVRGESVDVSALEGRIAFSSSTDDVYVINADGSRLRRLTSSRALDFDPAWSPQGTRIVYRHQSGDDLSADIHVMDADGSRDRRLTNDSYADWGPDWTPDGRRVVFNSSRGADSIGLVGYLINADGSGRERIPGDIFFEYPAISPDGKRVAFMSQTPPGTENYEIYVMNLDGSGLQRLTRSPGPDGWPAWSPDGTRIAFSSVRDDCVFSDAEDCLTTGDLGEWHTLYVMNADGSSQRRLTRTFAQFPAWSPDGEHILFAPFLNVIRPDGTGLTRIPVEGIGAEPEMPDWVAG